MEKRPYNLLKKNIDKLMEEALKKQVFTACSVGILIKEEKAMAGNIFNYGFAGENQEILPVDERTVFDLASLTKPLVTSLCVLVLMQEGKLDIDDTLDKFFNTGSSGHKNVTLIHLLTHSSGLPAHRPYYKKLVDFPGAERMELLIDWILTENLLFQPGIDNLYSDLGFILLGRIIEKVSGVKLDEYWRRKIIFPLDLEKGLFFASKRQKGTEVCVNTGKCSWSKIRLCGTVNDDNCRALGGVAGHAGLFGSAEALLSLCENIMLEFKGERQHPSYSSENLRKVLSNKQGPWRFGFDTPTGAFSSSGKHFSEMTVGHLGFTGTSFWIDLQRGIAIVLLTNRVLCGESLTTIKRLRPRIHDTIMEYLIKKPD
ncbi:MAG: beta-lactamase family protein [Desulfobulbaceae bacterium]|nr:beta-lactamase family protein [Desulfobulbaceae bacterium]